MKCFNTTGLCIPEKHYMVDITERLVEIKKMVDAGKYFVINRGRQYGKTTTLYALEDFLKDSYVILSLDFQNMGSAAFATERDFVQALSRLLMDLHEFRNVPMPEESLEAFELLNEKDGVKLDELFRILRRWCLKSEKPILFMIDEVDSASNNQVFLDFLAQLRFYYLEHQKDANRKTFQSVILAGVTDVRHLRSKLRDEEQHKVNSPNEYTIHWNIADVFDLDMSLSQRGIQGMLEEYERDHCTGMDTVKMARLIHEQTSGYPFLVSRLCQLIDEDVSRQLGGLAESWTRNGLDEALKLILAEKNTLFESLSGRLVNNPELKKTLRDILMEGKRVTYNMMNEAIGQMEMYGFIRNQHNVVVIANRIFETLLYNLFLSEEEVGKNAFTKAGDLDRNVFVTDGKLNMRLIMERFIDTYMQVFGPLEDKFKEKDGRELFLLYLRPIINGTGNYYIEAQTRDQTRTDVIVDYRGQQYVIELKIWRGPRYNEDGEQQLKEYLEYFGLDTGYMLSFNFNKKKEIGVKSVKVGEKLVYEGML